MRTTLFRAVHITINPVYKTRIFVFTVESNWLIDTQSLARVSWLQVVGESRIYINMMYIIPGAWGEGRHESESISHGSMNGYIVWIVL